MRYQIKQKLFSFTDHFDIADETGERVLIARRKFATAHAEYRIESLEGRELVRARQKMFSWRPRFDISQAGQHQATVQRRFTLRPRYSLDLASGAPISIQGSTWERHYEFSQAGKAVALVSRPAWALRDTYGVEIFEPQFDAIVLAAVIVIDALRSQQNSHT